jgi:hypothetical protein
MEIAASTCGRLAMTGLDSAPFAGMTEGSGNDRVSRERQGDVGVTGVKCYAETETL